MKRNEFGVKLDRNGYAPSIIQLDTEHCYLCGRCDQKLDRHEPIGGPFRKKSQRLGLWVTLCHESCHLGNAHKHFQTAYKLKQDAQAAAMTAYNWTTEDFIRIFGKNSLD